MAFQSGSTVLVSMPEFPDLVAAKVIHENKSGSYRVQLNDGTKVTIPGEDVFETKEDFAKAAKSPARKRSPSRKSGSRGRSPSRSRGKSPSRRKSPARKSAGSPKSPTTPPKVEIISPRKSERKPKIESDAVKETPSMTLRLRKWQPTSPSNNKLEMSVDSDGEENKAKKKGGKKDSDTTDSSKTYHKEWFDIAGLLSMFVVYIAILFICQLILRSANVSVLGLKPNQTEQIVLKVKGSLDVRKIDLRTLFRTLPKPDLCSAKLYFGFVVAQLVLALLPLGRLEKAVPGTPGPSSFRCNGIVNAILTLSTICVLKVYFNIGLSHKQLLDLIPQWTVLAIGTGTFVAIVCCIRASRLPLAKLNTSLTGTGKIFNFFMGKEVNPTLWHLNVKASLLKISCITTLTLQLLMYFSLDVSQRTPTLMLALGMITFYVGDVLLFERQIYTMFEYTSEGTGLMITLGYALYPFFPLLVTSYIATTRHEVSVYVCAAILSFYLLGFLVYRASNAEKAEFRRNPLNPCFANFDLIPTSRGKRLLCSGWWGYVRHPNYLGDIIMQICWGVIGGVGHPIPWVLPTFTVLLLLHRAARDNNCCQAKYGDAWDRYCEKVKYKVLPRVY